MVLVDVPLGSIEVPGCDQRLHPAEPRDEIRALPRVRLGQVAGEDPQRAVVVPDERRHRRHVRAVPRGLACAEINR